ncbi:MAG: alpha-L-rhamnosidase C-terminal domain-containing protein, partial [Oscillospiraceae bacterium]|nr:alpha-L-rhamnosidase C-terminal domain-containing protein [Oscillospiraceae bacterium]
AAITAKIVASCQYAVTVASYLEVLEALDEPEEKIERYRTLLGNIRRAVREEYVRADGTVEGDLQGLYVMVLYAGAVEGELAQKVADRLARLIEENGGGLDAGFVSVPHLLDMLAQNGHEDLAWKLLFRTEAPGWLYQVEHGATSMWENWNAVRPDGTVTTSSMNHYALGCVGDWIYRRIGGLVPVGAGWSEIIYAPALNCGLAWASCSHVTPYGLAACAWKVEGGRGEVVVTVPYGVKARAFLPDGERELSAGTHRIDVKL